MHLFDLPSEVLKTIIADECEGRKALKSFRLVCHVFNQLAQAALFSKIKLTMIENSCEICMPLLEALAVGTTNVHEHVRHLEATIICRGEPAPNPDEEVQYKTREYFLKAIDKLKGIHSVQLRFDLELPDSNWASAGLIDAMTRMVDLTSLAIDLSGAYIPKFNDLRNLQSLELYSNPDKLSDHASTHGATILSNNPEITSLNIHCSDQQFHSRENRNTGDAIFHKLPHSMKPLKIIHLNTRGCDPIRLTDNVLRHLMNLRSLTYHPETYEPDDTEENKNEDRKLRGWPVRVRGTTRMIKIERPLPVVVEDIERRRPLATAFWDTLRAKEIHLESLVVNRVDHATLRYIASFSGLRSLYIGRIDASRQTLVEHLANMFFEDAITNHLETLEELTIIGPFSSSWCFGAHNTALFSQCRKLRSLSLTWDAPANDSEKTLSSMIDLSSTLPLLQKFVIHIAYPRGMREARCGNAFMDFCHSACERVQDCLPKYGPLDVEKHPTEIEVDNLVFRLKECEDGYRYQFSRRSPSTWNRF